MGMFDADRSLSGARMLSSPLTVFAINLDRDIDRWRDVATSFAKVEGVSLTRLSGVMGSQIPLTARRALQRYGPDQPGTIGCFLAHVSAWEKVAEGLDWGLIIEDDCRPCGLERIFKLDIPANAEIIFVNARMDVGTLPSDAKEPRVYPTTLIVPKKAVLPKLRSAPGGDAYLLNPSGARKLLAAVARDGFSGHVDWRLLRYTLDAANVRRLAADTWLLEKSPLLPDNTRLSWNVLKGYCASPALTARTFSPSSRISINGQIDESETATPKNRNSVVSPIFASCRVAKGSTAIVSVSDLELNATGPEVDFPIADALPYCFDMPQQELILSLHENPKVLLSAPFLYVAQRNEMSRIARVPFSALDDYYGKHDPSVRPTFIFSVGRVGSTLLDGLLGCVMPMSVSEPDVTSQLATPMSGFRRLTEDRRDLILWHSLSPFFFLAGHDCVSFKFRSQVNGIAAEFARTFPKAHFVFMLRDRTSWGRSTFRAFRMSPDRVAQRLTHGLKALAELRKAGVLLSVIWYEELISEPENTLRRIIQKDTPFDPLVSAQLANIMTKDSQSGTSLSRERTSFAVRDEDQWLTAFDDEWAKVRSQALIDAAMVDFL